MDRSIFKGPIFYRLFTTIALTYCVAKTINYVYPDTAHGSRPQVESVKKTRESQDRSRSWQEHWDKANTNGSTNQPDVIHLMLPIWIRRTKPQPWDPDDPTWKSIQSLHADTKRLREITKAIQESLKREVVKKYGRVLLELGGKFAFHAGWRLAPPLYAPTTYEVPCIFLEPGTVSYGWRQLPNSMGGKMDRVFHPIVLAKAFFYGFREFAWASYLITKARLIDQLNSLGATVKDPSTPQNPLSEDEKAHRRLSFGKISEKDKTFWLPFLRGEYGEHDSRRAYRDLVKSMTYQGAIESGCAVFRAYWIHGQEKIMQSYTRDSVLMVGEIAFVGDRGTLFVHAVAVYSPETDSLIGPPILKHAYVVPDREKWVEEKVPNPDENDLLQTERQEQTKLIAREALKPSTEPGEAQRTGKPPSSEENQEKNGEK
ncbi:uncharacterized protein A1O5_09368 [Cladophialophora psammophila CBS 110553]|uniref:Uncharacterized protein n=1 Tax=Cladophialophora psammophila CBS 110553 TaxID=1182543 RepID=W9WQX2_9EURO|nr:uncharacterized protein A1O5_09368 [Cladophialophora psammophila CBS 110553]EXJ67355.1 hypothetical protein A1O5_09368 [Cladophialophora psammophila CBS 110553]